MNANPVLQAAEIVGSQKLLAQHLGVTPQAVHQWVLRGRPPAERVLAIEDATQGAVRREQLRPDLYGPVKETAA